MRALPDRLRAALAPAIERRRDVARDTDALRVIDDEADDCPGIVVDRYGDFATLSLTDPAAIAAADDLSRVLVEHGFRGAYVKIRPRADLRRAPRTALAATVPVCGEPAPAELIVSERDLRVRVFLDDGLSTGLFTDQRDNRVLVRALSGGARLLNLFAYTCTFTVAAALGGARETVSVDLSQRALDRGRDNLVLNGVWGPAHRLVRADAVPFAARLARRDAPFDVIVLDPPSFGTRGRATFSVERDYATLAEHCLRALAPRGHLLAVTNHRKTTLAHFRSLIASAAASAARTLAEVRNLPPPADHPHRPGGAVATKALLVRVT